MRRFPNLQFPRDWAVGGTAAAEKEAWLDLEKRITPPWHGVIQMASELRMLWQERSAAEVARREAMERGRSWHTSCATSRVA